jgi:hypothetical protein
MYVHVQLSLFSTSLHTCMCVCTRLPPASAYRALNPHIMCVCANQRLQHQLQPQVVIDTVSLHVSRRTQSVVHALTVHKLKAIQRLDAVNKHDSYVLPWMWSCGCDHGDIWSEVWLYACVHDIKSHLKLTHRLWRLRISFTHICICIYVCMYNTCLSGVLTSTPNTMPCQAFEPCFYGTLHIRSTLDCRQAYTPCHGGMGIHGDSIHGGIGIQTMLLGHRGNKPAPDTGDKASTYHQELGVLYRISRLINVEAHFYTMPLVLPCMGNHGCVSLCLRIWQALSRTWSVANICVCICSLNQREWEQKPLSITEDTKFLHYIWLCVCVESNFALSYSIFNFPECPDYALRATLYLIDCDIERGKQAHTFFGLLVWYKQHPSSDMHISHGILPTCGVLGANLCSTAGQKRKLHSTFRSPAAWRACWHSAGHDNTPVCW